MKGERKVAERERRERVGLEKGGYSRERNGTNEIGREWGGAGCSKTADMFSTTAVEQTE